MYSHALWRLNKYGKWEFIQALDSDKYPCCASHEKILPIGVNPNKPTK